MDLEEKVEVCRVLLRPIRDEMDHYLNGLICDFIYYDASVETLGKIRSSVRGADFMGYPVREYYGIWDELSVHLGDYQKLQTEAIKYDRNIE